MALAAKFNLDEEFSDLRYAPVDITEDERPFDSFQDFIEAAQETDPYRELTKAVRHKILRDLLSNPHSQPAFIAKG
jgi:hypothetical protein